jgi:metallo-beta-lactamase class B
VRAVAEPPDEGGLRGQPLFLEYYPISLKSLPVDVFLGAHGDYYGMDAKYPKIKAGGPNPFIDPAGYKAYVADREAAFRKELAKQKAGAKL